MSNSNTNNTCMTVSIVVAAVVVGLLAYFISTVTPLWVAILAFLVLLALGLWLAQKICGGSEAEIYKEELEQVRAEDSGETAVEAEPAPEEDSESLADLAASINTDPVEEAEAPAGEPAAETAEQTRPEALSAARDGKGDDLKKIRGVGPKMEKMLNEMGFFHFDQIAAWSAAEVAWVDDNLQGFKGRATRDNWVEQAKTLAAGGETEFSKKVDKGGVY